MCYLQCFTIVSAVVTRVETKPEKAFSQVGAGQEMLFHIPPLTCSLPPPKRSSSQSPKKGSRQFGCARLSPLSSLTRPPSLTQLSKTDRCCYDLEAETRATAATGAGAANNPQIPAQDPQVFFSNICLLRECILRQMYLQVYWTDIKQFHMEIIPLLIPNSFQV